MFIKIKRRQKLGKNNNNLYICQAGITQVNMDKVNWYCVHATDPHTPKKQQWLAEKERCVWGLCPQPPLTHPPPVRMSLITVTIFHHVKTTFVWWTGLFASLEFLEREQLLSERSFSLLSRAGKSNNLVLPFNGFILFFSNCPIQSLMETCPSLSPHKACGAPGNLYTG